MTVERVRGPYFKMIPQKKYSNYLLTGIVIYFVISLACCSCKVHKSIQKEVSKSDSSVFVNNEQHNKTNIDSAGIATKENNYGKLTIELGDNLLLNNELIKSLADRGIYFNTSKTPDFGGIKNNDTGKTIIPKGTKITYETGTEKQTEQATKNVSIESSQKENSKVEVTKKEMHLNKTVDKTMPSKWEVILFCFVLLICGVVFKFRKPILSHIKGWITGV